MSTSMASPPKKSFSSDISYTKYSSDLNLGEGLCICTSFHFPDSGLNLLFCFCFMPLTKKFYLFNGSFQLNFVVNWPLNAA